MNFIQTLNRYMSLDFRKKVTVSPTGDIPYRWICESIGHDMITFDLGDSVRLICVRCGKEVK